MTKDATSLPVGPIEISDTDPMRHELVRLNTLPVVSIALSSLLLDQSPRHGGENGGHTRLLAESQKPLPPIVVHGPSRRVIDGIHRVRAAIIRGDNTIAAREYHGTEDDAFLLAVRLNIAHGLPLTRAERTAAAVQILRWHPQWSDRMIATTVGLSPRTVAKARQRSTAQSTQSTTRLGQDGRLRPIDPTAARLRISALLADHPTAPNRTIAHEAGVSASTVHQVRQRLRAGRPPTPDPHRPRSSAAPHQGSAHARAFAGGGDIAAILTNLKQDPAQQTSDITQALLRSLDRYRIEIAWANQIIGMVPPRWATPIAQLAREYARIWAHIATQLDHRPAHTHFATIPQPRGAHQPSDTEHHHHPTAG